MKDKRILIIAGLVAVLLIAIPLTVYIANQQQDVRSNAQVPAQVADNTVLPTDTPIPTSTFTPTPSPSPSPTVVVSPTAAGGSCQTPAAVSGVELSYPSCQGTQCNFTQASCSWAAVNGAVSYSITVTQVESGSVTSTTTVTAPTVTYSFPVTQGQTYRCDISAVNACGASGTAGTAQAVCQVDGQVSASPTSPVQPTQPLQATQPVVPPQVIPTVAATGDTNTTVLVGIGGVVVAIVGGFLFFFSGL